MKSIQIGDLIKITKPEMIIRVGYEFTHEEACEEVKTNHMRDICDLMMKVEVVNNKLIERRIISALAWGIVRNKIKGGNVRNIYSEIKEEYRDKIVKVIGKRRAITGTYLAGYNDGYSDDAEPPKLLNQKVHMILELDEIGMLTSKPVEIESINVIKI